jgi:hypothetical protein
MAFPDHIERTVEIARPVAAVWAALTTAEGLGTWFGNLATIDLRPGGTARIAWSTGDKADLRIGRVEEPRSSASPGTSTACPTTTRAAPTSSSRSNRSARERG